MGERTLKMLRSKSMLFPVYKTLWEGYPRCWNLRLQYTWQAIGQVAHTVTLDSPLGLLGETP